MKKRKRNGQKRSCAIERGKRRRGSRAAEIKRKAEEEAEKADKRRNRNNNVSNVLGM